MLSFNRKYNIQTGYLPSSQVHLPELGVGMGNLFDGWWSHSRWALVAVPTFGEVQDSVHLTAVVSAQDLILHLLYLKFSDSRKKGYILKEYLKDRILVLAAD